MLDCDNYLRSNYIADPSPILWGSHVSKETSVDHVTQNMETYNRIAEHYYVTATPELRAWKEESMRRFAALLPGPRVVVPGCGDGRDSRFLASLALQVTSFDLSDAMLRIARERHKSGTYLKLDLRDMANVDRSTAFGPAVACIISAKPSSSSA